ncbi:hypothetical protein GWK47_007167 [Chionoecetes opilio]|uniref:Uncharacterized protein n=1 Tax=Chionoecetes opilio TaxID=41210 RepID=A0A8J5CRG3_CHIOP|nr:hypothetical protein GWK47_007167 [Chionoecetes opilio]
MYVWYSSFFKALAASRTGSCCLISAALSNVFQESKSRGDTRDRCHHQSRDDTVDPCSPSSLMVASCRGTDIWPGSWTICCSGTIVERADIWEPLMKKGDNIIIAAGYSVAVAQQQPVMFLQMIQMTNSMSEARGKCVDFKNGEVGGNSYAQVMFSSTYYRGLIENVKRAHLQTRYGRMPCN